jgi:hypothetical protein
MMKFHYVRYCTLSEVWDCWWNKADWDTHYISENGHGAWVTLCAHLTHTNTDSDHHSTV